MSKARYLRKCTGCGEDKEESEQNFRIRYRREDGTEVFNARCRSCVTNRQRRYMDSRKRETREYFRKYYLENKEEIKTRNEEYRRRNQPKALARVRKYKGLASRDSEQYDFVPDVCERDGWICYLCLGQVNQSLTNYHPMMASPDHVVPISRGGRDAPDNVRLAHLRCNLRKASRLLEEMSGELPFEWERIE